MSAGVQERALTAAVRAAEVQPRHRAAVAAARRLAQLLDAARGTADEAAAWERLGPKYLAALTAAGLTLSGSAPAPATAATSPAQDALSALRAKRAGS